MKTISEIKEEGNLPNTLSEIAMFQSLFVSQVVRLVGYEFNNPEMALRIMDALQETQKKQRETSLQLEHA